MESPEITRALYRSVVEINNEALIETFARHVGAAAATMLASASDASFADMATVTPALLTTIFSTVCNVFERNLPVTEGHAVQGQLMAICNAYLGAVGSNRSYACCQRRLAADIPNSLGQCTAAAGRGQAAVATAGCLVKTAA
ncbi:hypothetical protein [uncultured Sphingomonas sp.]|uniref:hypothetical protein n=1 Tax=uncultured Sphingomonas sp. TaxID=158754 RepID=UPI0035CBCBEF